MKKLFAGLGLAMLAIGAVGQEPAVIAGAGASLMCGDWMADRAKTSRGDADLAAKARQGFALMWVQGFLSGLNTERMNGSPKQQFAIPSSDVIEALIEKSCKSDPLRSIWIASFVISEELHQRNPLPKKK